MVLESVCPHVAGRVALGVKIDYATPLAYLQVLPCVGLFIIVIIIIIITKLLS